MVACDFPPYTYDDDLVEGTRRDGQTRVRVYRLTDTVVVLGSGSRPEVELHLDACHADGVPILRRRGGGCAVVLDRGTVIVSVVMSGLPFGHHRRHFDVLTDWLIAGLGRIDITGVDQAGICDLVHNDKKVGGACLHRSRDLLYYSASLLIEPELDKVTRYLQHPPREPAYRRGRHHASFMGSLGAVTGTTSSPDTLSGAPAAEVANRLARALILPLLGEGDAVPRPIESVSAGSA